MAFTLTVVANFVAMGVGKGAQPPAWITYAPLLPLALLLFTGIWIGALNCAQTGGMVKPSSPGPETNP
jgi:hypothetical protein